MLASEEPKKLGQQKKSGEIRNRRYHNNLPVLVRLRMGGGGKDRWRKGIKHGGGLGFLGGFWCWGVVGGVLGGFFFGGGCLLFCGWVLGGGGSACWFFGQCVWVCFWVAAGFWVCGVFFFGGGVGAFFGLGGGLV